MRCDVSKEVTVLGCTLFSWIDPEQRDSVVRSVSDFADIEGWTVASHNVAHQSELQWLNSEVSKCAQYEPHRSIVILTHYCPTVLEVAIGPRHVQDDAHTRSAFVTDLSNEVCWTCPKVKLWTFGHTHFNCDFIGPQTGKRVVTNQKGYRSAEAPNFDRTKVLTIKPDSYPGSSRFKRAKGGQGSSTERKQCTVS